MKIKTFRDNKAYAINYLNKVKKNQKINFCMLALSAEYHGWIVMYN